MQRRLTRGRRGSSPVEGSNWFVRPGRSDRERFDLRLLDTEHGRRWGLASLTGADLDAPRCAAAHDLYHGGRIPVARGTGAER